MPAFQFMRRSRPLTRSSVRTSQVRTAAKQMANAIPRARRSSVIGRTYVGPYLDIAFMLVCGLILIRATEKFFRLRSSAFLDEQKTPDSEADAARQDALDKTLADSFPSSDPPSSIPDPTPVSPGSTLGRSAARKGKL